jgi:hypothetical protein
MLSSFHSFRRQTLLLTKMQTFARAAGVNLMLSSIWDPDQRKNKSLGWLFLLYVGEKETERMKFGTCYRSGC